MAFYGLCSLSKVFGKTGINLQKRLAKMLAKTSVVAYDSRKASWLQGINQKECNRHFFRFERTDLWTVNYDLQY